MCSTKWNPIVLQRLASAELHPTALHSLISYCVTWTGHDVGNVRLICNFILYGNSYAHPLNTIIHVDAMSKPVKSLDEVAFKFCSIIQFIIAEDLQTRHFFHYFFSGSKVSCQGFCYPKMTQLYDQPRYTSIMRCHFFVSGNFISTPAQAQAAAATLLLTSPRNGLIPTENLIIPTDESCRNFNELPDTWENFLTNSLSGARGKNWFITPTAWF